MQTLDIEPVVCLGHRGSFGIGARGVLHISDDLPVLGKCDHMAVCLRHWPQDPRKAQDDLIINPIHKLSVYIYMNYHKNFYAMFTAFLGGLANGMVITDTMLMAANIVNGI